MSTENRQDLLAKVGAERRDFLKKISIAAAFAAPTIATFSIDGMRKKAFAQAAYDPPQVVDLQAPSAGQAVVTFSQPMDTGTGDRSRDIGPCRTTSFDSGDYPYEWAWDGNTRQVISFSGFGCSEYLNITYNQSCGGAAKFFGANGLELMPYSGRILVDGPEGC